jgi:hypothetical protein
MTCRHKRICDVSNLIAGVWSTARRCLTCKEWVGMGEARDTTWVLYEVEAALFAGRVASGKRIRDVVPRLAGFTLHEPADPRELEYSQLVRDLYDCGLLARYIHDHEKEEGNG